MRNNFYNRFRQFIEKEKLFDEGLTVLLAVSGGVDSVVMARLFARAGFHFSIAHCNFQLRSGEADADELFVQQLAQQLGVPFHSTRFDTLLHAERQQVSIQMTARDLRYAWFNSIAKEHAYQYIATAHHKNDSVETIILNLVKGAVLDGLLGIPVKNGNIIRPILWAEKKEIAAYAEREDISYREDASNASDKYQRNLIRNQVIPLLENLNPDVIRSMASAIGPRMEIDALFKKACWNKWDEITTEKDNYTSIEISSFIGIGPAMMYEWFRLYGFTAEQINSLKECLFTSESKQFMSSTHRILKERTELILEPLQAIREDNYFITPQTKELECGSFRLNIKEINIQDIGDLKNPLVACLDADKISFPLELRLWKHGDSFQPYGMRGRKLVSDYLTDIKASQKEKENQYVLLSCGRIAWLVGRRIDDYFKIDGNTSRALCVSIS
jgi:tRNA(Ile)-lysidine synthase